MSNKKVLLVDDSDTALMMGKMILTQRTSYDLVTARDGREAVEKSASEKPNLILMDVVMPNMNGLEACRAIRENPATQHIPVILVTTRGEPDSVEAGFASGCNDYVTKPLNASELVSVLASYLED
jgi:CheY-like chemotaxis protein